MLPARIAGRCGGVRPADADIVFRADLLGECDPGAVALPLILELQILRNIAPQVLPDAINRQAKIEGVLSAYLESPFIRDIGEVRR